MSLFPHLHLAFAAALLLPAAASAAIFTVNDASDGPDFVPGEGVCATNGGTCTLRAAIMEANALGGSHIIRFNVATGDPDTPALIAPNSNLPNITVPLLIDGTTQPGASVNTSTVGHNADIRIRLDGANVPGPAAGLLFNSGATGAEVRGLAITRFSWYGVNISGAANVTIAGNFIGTDGSGTGGDEAALLANGFPGIEISNNAAGAIIGGTALADRNLIVGASNSTGIRLSHALDATVRGNYIGTDRSGTSHQGTWLGISVSRTENTTTVADNVIGAGQRGILIDNGVRNVNIQANLIGVGADGTANIGGEWYGIHITNGGQSVSSPGNIAVAGNTIANWTGNGIRAQHVGTNAPPLGYLGFTRNSIYGNGGLGIELIDSGTGEGLTPGSPAPAAVNSGQNPPTIQSALGSAAGTMVQFSFAGAPGSDQTMEIFANPACHASGWGEGRTYLGQLTVTTDSSGNYAGSTTVPAVPPGSYLTMTASRTLGTDIVLHETSELSRCIAITPGSAGGAISAVPALDSAALALLSPLLGGLGWHARLRRRTKEGFAPQSSKARPG